MPKTAPDDFVLVAEAWTEIRPGNAKDHSLRETKPRVKGSIYWDHSKKASTASDHRSFTMRFGQPSLTTARHTANAPLTGATASVFSKNWRCCMRKASYEFLALGKSKEPRRRLFARRSSLKYSSRFLD